MKKLISLIMISIILITLSTAVYAADTDEGLIPIPKDEYEEAQKEEGKKGNEKLPQTGIEDSGVGVLLVICVASAIFAYKKVSDYRGV